MKCTVFRILAAFLVATALVPVAARAQTEIPPGYVLVDDMILPRDAFRGDSNYLVTSWPGGVVPYTFNTNVNSAKRTAARTAMDELEAIANVSFVPRASEADYVEFSDSSVNNSRIGLAGGMQSINLYNWNVKYIMVHEMIHALGFTHEQCRTDRDTYVTINSANISTTECTGSACGGSGSSSCTCNFDIFSTSTNVGEYDFLSIMHYGRTAFSTNGQDTITCNAGYTSHQSEIGNRTFMTALDAGGIRNRYGAPPVPTLASIAPTIANVGTPGIVLDVYGTHFFEGSPTADGVQGTVVRWNSIELSTTYLSGTHLQAYLPSNLLANPGTAQITLENPSPAGGVGVGSPVFTVTCGSPTQVLLFPGVPRAGVSFGCQGFSMASLASAWNVAAVSSPSDWDMAIGGSTSALGQGSTDFLAFDGSLGPVSPTGGSVFRYAGNSDATLEYVHATPITLGTPAISSIPAGSIVRAYSVYNPNLGGSFQITLAGSQSLRWWLLWSPGSPTWRGPSQAAGSGIGGVATANVANLSIGVHCIVVTGSGGPLAADEDFTLDVCANSPATTSLSPGSPATISNACQPFVIVPLASRWNVVGVASTSDWDIALGTAVSQFGGSLCDYVIADGHAGGVTPSAGNIARYAGTTTAVAEFCATRTLAAWPGTDSASNVRAAAAFEFQVVQPGNYDLTVSAPPGFSFDLHVPTPSPAWRRRADATIADQPVGTTVAGLGLQAGWHCVVVRRDGGPNVNGALVGLTGTLSAVQPPILASVAPSEVFVASGPTTITIDGSGFDPASVVRVDGVAVATNFLSANRVEGIVDQGSTQVAGAVAITVATPGAGVSNALALAVVHDLPVVTGWSPQSATAGTAGVGITIDGSGFAPGTVVRWNGTRLPLPVLLPTQVVADVSANDLAQAGTATIEVFNPAPGGGSAGPFTFTIQPLPPSLSAVTPPSLPAGSPATTILLDGQAFTFETVVRIDGLGVPTTWVSDTQLSAELDATSLEVPTTLSVIVFEPNQGIESGAVPLAVPAPAIAAVTPPSMPPLLPTASAVRLQVLGSDFLPGAVVHADGFPLVTTFVDGTQLLADLVASVPGSGRIGGVVLNVQNAPAAPEAVSNSAVVVVGSASNAGTMRRQPLAPHPGESYALLVEGCAAFAPLTFVVDAGVTVPLGAWPDPVTDLVIAVTPIAGSAGPFLALFDGIGIFGPPDGTSTDASGGFVFPGLSVPNPLLGLDLTLQAAYLDPAAPLGFSLTFARFPERL